MELAVLRKRFFNTAVADVLRAARGKSLTGSAILAICVVDYLANLQPRCPGNGATFKQFVRGYLVKDGYDPDKLWALRNAMVHSYAKPDKQLKEFVFTHTIPNFHLKGGSEKLQIDVRIWLGDVILAAYAFFEKAEADSTLRQHVEKKADSLFKILDADAKAAAQSYFDMDVALRQLDLRPLDEKLLRADINAVFDHAPASQNLATEAASGVTPSGVTQLPDPNSVAGSPVTYPGVVKIIIARDPR